MSNLARSFDTLHYAKRLKSVGVKEKEAEIHAEAIAEAINILIDEKIATKSDLKHLESEIKADLKYLESDIKALEERIDSRLKEMGYKMTIRLGGMIVAGFAVFGVIIKLI